MRLGTITETKRPLDLDLDTLVATRLLVTATSGGGKSWALRRILEQTHGQVQQIVLDPEGEFPSLRGQLDYVLAGKGGDVAARPETAAKLAEHLLELKVSAVCDLYELKAAERKRFVRLFLDAMINAPKRLWHPVLVAIDEAHTYCPEKGQAESAEAVIDLCTRGRKRGFCAVLATQRVSNLDKQAAAQCTNVMVGPTFQDIDRRRSVEILGADSRTAERELKAGLMRLKPGDFWCMGRAFSQQARTLVRVGGVKTQHPQIAGGRKALPGPAPPSAKVKAMLARLVDIPREAEEEANELVSLRTRMGELGAELRRRPVEKVGITEEQLAEHMTRRDLAWEAKLTAALAEVACLSKAMKTVQSHALSISRAVGELPAEPPKIEPPEPWEVQKRTVAAARRERPPSIPAPRSANPPQSVPAVDGDYRPRAGARRMVEALARYHLGSMTVSQLRTMARLRKSGTSDTYLSELVRHGLISREGNEVRITDAGLAMVGDAARDPMTAGETLEEWRQVFRAGARRMLDSLVEDRGRGMTREQLGQTAGLKKSGTFSTYLGQLKRNGLAVESDGLVRLAEFLLEA